MYEHQEEWDVEKVCYNNNHIAEVIDELHKNFEDYFQKFIQTEAGVGVSEQEFEELQKKFGTKSVTKGSIKQSGEVFKKIIARSYKDFEIDRQKYLDIFDMDRLEEYKDDPANFKSQILKNECPIIHATLFNRHAKSLDKYRGQFSRTPSQDLLEVIISLCKFAENYMENVYDQNTYDEIDTIEDLELSPLDQDECYIISGVIGGGIKSHMLFKVHPSVFPNRSRSAIWSLWYLTGKKDFGCKYDSEFLRMDVEKNIMQQNYAYPYDLFSFYALEIFRLLNQKAEEMGAYIDSEYRYVIVDAFLNFVAKLYQKDIDELVEQIHDGDLEYV